MASTGFGSWYEEKKQEDGPEASSSWFGTGASSFGFDMTGDTLPLFNSEAMQNFSFANMKQAMEAQMPKKILGMGYQQRFQVRSHFIIMDDALFVALLPCQRNT